MQYECIQAKSLLSKLRLGESWFHSNRSMNAYRGCEHACIYCDGMSEYYHVDNFTTHIRIKENAPQVLRRELERFGFTSKSKLESSTLVRFLSQEDATRIAEEGPRKQIIGVCGGVSDGYQPAEQNHRVTRQVLETLLDFEMPVFILTKSNLVLRDLELLKEIHKRAFANVCFSITLYDEETKSIFEPKSSTTSERFEALREIRKAGLYGGVMAYPTIPGVGDTFENMRNLAKKAKQVGAEFIQFAGMTLKPGRQKEYFFNVIQKRLPDRYDLIHRIYSNNHRLGHPIMDLLPVNPIIQGRRVCKEVGIRDRSVRHPLPQDPEPNRYVLGVLLDIEFYSSMALGLPRYQWKPYQDLAIRIEQGVGDLEQLRSQEKLAETLKIGPRMVSLIEETLDTGTCKELTNLQTKIDSLAHQDKSDK